jgi:hypothetical protein
MAKQSKQTTGKKWAPRSKDKREARIHCRLPEELYAVLERAAERNGWTVSAELVDRLQQSFALPATPTQAIMAMVAYAIDGLAPGKTTWLTDPYLHQEARMAAWRALQLLQPKNYPPPPEATSIQPSGRVALECWWNDVRHFDPSSPINSSQPQRAQQHQRRLAKLRNELGTLPETVELWGMTGREARRRHQEILPLAEQQAFTKLARKRVRYGLSPEEHQRFRELERRTPQPLQLGDLSNPGPFPDWRLEEDLWLDRKIDAEIAKGGSPR